MNVLHTIQHLKLTYVKDAELKKKKRRNVEIQQLLGYEPDLSC